MNTALKCVAPALLCFLLSATLAAQEAQIDSLIAQGQAAFEANKKDQAIKALTAAIKQNPDNIQTYLAVARIYIKAEYLNHAMKAFKEALKLNDASPEAQTGIAEIYYKKASGGIMAVYHARKAVSAARRATRLDPTYASAYVLLGRAYIRLNENHTAASRAFAQALTHQPDNPEIAYLLGTSYIELRRNAEGRQRDSQMILNESTLKNLGHHLENARFLPIAAQILFDKGEPEKALNIFEQFIATLPETERAYYDDIARVGTKEEIKTYEATPEAERPAFLEQFWAKRDFDLLTEVNERLIEHYRRVWYARNHFAEAKTPWDARGDIYIRYGDPDYRARSGRANPEITPAVEQVKERLALALYGPEAMDEVFTGPVYPIRSNQSFVGELDPAALARTDEGGNILVPPGTFEGNQDEFVLTEALGADGEASGEVGEIGQLALDEYQRRQMRPENQHHFLPVTSRGDMTIVSWETWVYTHIGEGIEITFTNELGSGVYSYAPLPDFPHEETTIGLHRYSLLAYYAPEAIANRTVSEVPDFYTPGGPMSGLGFHYDFADFRGSDGTTRLEIYYGIDPIEMGTFASGDTSTIVADCAVILADTSYTNVYRSQDAIFYRSIGHRMWPEGSFIPTLIPIDVPPGNYLLTVQVNDRAAERKGIYRHQVHVEPYQSNALQLSDIQLSWNISENPGDEKFRKGDVWVVPMISRAYQKDQSAYAYYELYNLTRNEFGQTRYRVTYTITVEDPIRPFNLVRSSVGALARIFQRQDRTQVKVSFDQTGNEQSIAGYFELSLKKVKAGYNRLTVTVEDLNNGQKAAKEIQFRYKK